MWIRNCFDLNSFNKIPDMLIRNKRTLKFLSVFLLAQFLFQIFLPTLGYALTSGPSHPEFSSFEPVATTEMVDEFTGDFTYNLPVLEVPGPNGSSYPLSLSYHSGVTPEEESSWVGYGWSLNPGAINRNVRGLPDDFKAKAITYNNKMPKNWTATVGSGFTFGELFSKDISLGFNAALRYNNYRGFGYNAGVGLVLGKGLVSLGYNVSDGQGSFSLGVNPAGQLSSFSLNHRKAAQQKKIDAALEKSLKNGGYFVRPPSADYSVGINSGSSSINLAGSKYGFFMGGEIAKPSVVSKYSGASFNVSFGISKNPGPVPMGFSTNIFGSYSSQTNEPSETVPAYGSLYSGLATANGVMDYHVEKETDFNKRDVFLGMPFSDPDHFMVTGEGLGGGFKLYSKKVGHFGPRNVKSDIGIFNTGGDISIGWTFGVGVDLGVGKSTLEMGDWNRNLTTFSKPDDLEDEPMFFRFNNDLGGEWGTNHNDRPVNASISGGSASLPAGISQMNKNGERSGRSSYIGYNVNEKMLKPGNVPSERAYNKNSSINDISNRSATDIELKDLVGEISVSNESGYRYLYALPVYNKNEISLSWGIEGARPQDISNNFIVYNTQRSDVKVGEEQGGIYASTYLLTEITSPDYLDRTEDGPTQDDFGGYTRFNYVKMTPSNDWYNWRMPYRGLFYNKNSHSDPKDDLGSYSEGEKEIYYLKTIETKTHVAFFHLLPKDDAKEAPINPLTRTAVNQGGGISLQKLDRIELYSIQDCTKDGSGIVIRTSGNPTLAAGAKPIKTVYFKYENNLCNGLPNSAGGVGKLKLKSVFFEYNGISKTRLSPYQFTYEYPTYSTYPSKYTSGQENVTAGYSSLSAADQNPAYNEFLSDAWGNYQKDGQTRFNNMENWIDQKNTSNLGGFDPAAWHLKVIKLPSGGEIHVQYEQDDYNYVQDQEAHVMMNIASVNNSTGQIYLNAIPVGLTNASTNTDLLAIRDMINKRYVAGGKKIYFRILYSILGISTPNLASCNADFITGFASVSSCGIDTGGLFVNLNIGGNNRMPVEVCKDFAKTHLLGKIDPSGNCVPGMNDSGNPAGVVRQLLGMVSGIVAPSNLCAAINPVHSYLRVPFSLPKKGGGLRVKRLMTFDNSLGGEAVLYGNEYQYQTIVNGRIISSGVATNEPGTIRDENVMVDFVARKSQDLSSKIIAGKDLKQSEGPLGESILPAPSVGYSKVTVKNIHSGKTNPGFSIAEFYTAKDFPISLAHPNNPNTMTPFAGGTPDKLYLNTLFVNIIKDKTRVSQGFSFVLNAMHGQVKSKASFSGPYTDVISLSKSTLVSQVNYEYFKPGEKVPVISSLFGDFTMKNPGREVDLTFAQKKVLESSYDANIEVDLQFAMIFFFPIVYVTAMPALNFTDGALYTHATTKVIRYPSILKKVTVYQDGILHTEENVAFDEYTGKPVAVKSSDEFKGAYLAQSVPASWEYDNFKPKAQSEQKVIKNTSINPGTTMTFSSTSGGTDGFLSVSGSACSLMAQLTTGDLLQLNSTYYYHVKSIDYTKDRLELVVKGSNLLPSTTAITAASIFNSGRNNRLGENAGDVSFHNPVEANVTTSSIAVSDAQRYISSGTDNSDGSLFVKDLNDAFVNPALLPLKGPYLKMNVSQFAPYVPGGCGTDLTNASIRNVYMVFKSENGSISVSIGTFEVLCGSTWQLVKMPI